MTEEGQTDIQQPTNDIEESESFLPDAIQLNNLYGPICDYGTESGKWSCCSVKGSFGLFKGKKRFCLVGPHWMMMSTTYILLIATSTSIFVVVSSHLTVLESIVACILTLMCLLYFSLTACSDPGIVERISIPGNQDWPYCLPCDSYRPPGAVHCDSCQACILGYDHHCPWTGKCIGRRNICYFYIWLFFLVLTLGFGLYKLTTTILPPKSTILHKGG